MIYDFVDLKQKVKEKILSKLDHSYINDILPQPTAEYIAQWIFKELDDAVKRENCELHEVKLWETETSSVTCTREDI